MKFAKTCSAPNRRGVWIATASTHSTPQEINELGHFILETIAERQSRKQPMPE